MTSTRSARRAPRERRGPLAFTLVGIVVLLAAGGLLALSLYEALWRPPVDASGGNAPEEAVAVLRIPVLDGAWPVLAGTGDDVLARGLGWYDGTTEPGQVGNFAVAGHGGLSGPLGRLDQLHRGDEVVVETPQAVYTYRLSSDPAATSIADTDTWVLQPVPGHPELRPTKALITLTTSAGPLRPADRIVAFGTLADTRAR